MPLSVLAQTGDVQGTVYQQSTGRPLAAADVHILEIDQHQKTDENGIFRLTPNSLKAPILLLLPIRLKPYLRKSPLTLAAATPRKSKYTSVQPLNSKQW